MVYQLLRRIYVSYTCTLNHYLFGLWIPWIPLLACLLSTHTIARQLSLSVPDAISLSVHYLAGPDWYLNKVKLKITDVNDNFPEWDMKPYPYLAVVSPEAPAGTFVYQLQAHDGDEGKSGEVEYFLSDGKCSVVYLHIVDIGGLLY